MDQCKLWGFASVEGNGLATTTGGLGNKSFTVDNLSDLKLHLKTDEPKTIFIKGEITSTSAKMLDVHSNKTLIGQAGATLKGFGLNISNANNIILRNLNFENSLDDSINIQNGSHHIWIDHNSFHQATDGTIDIKNGSDFITISWNHFKNTTLTTLIGHTNTNTSLDQGKLRVTLHNNWFNQTTMRNPRVRFGMVHVANNYYDSIPPTLGEGYGVASTENAEVFLENNYFKNTPIPTFIGYKWSGIEYSKPGKIVAKGNQLENSGPIQTWGEAFDPGEFYEYAVEDAKLNVLKVKKLAGAGIIACDEYTK